MTLTPSEQRTECAYVCSERLGMICEDRIPTPAELAQAEQCAAEWQRRYTANHPRDGQKELL